MCVDVPGRGIWKIERTLESLVGEFGKLGALMFLVAEFGKLSVL